MEAILLDGGKNDVIKLPVDMADSNVIIFDRLGIGIDEQIEFFTFGDKYVMFWQENEREKVSAEITVAAGLTSDEKIESKVVIVKYAEDFRGFQEANSLVNISMLDLKDHFEIGSEYWSLTNLSL